MSGSKLETLGAAELEHVGDLSEDTDGVLNFEGDFL